MNILTNLPFVAVALMLIIGFYGIIFKKNLIKMAIGLTIVEAAVNLFLVSLGYVKGGIAPVFTLAPREEMVAPTVQALTLTSIVIGLGVTALMLALIIRIYQHYDSINTDDVRRLKG